MIKIKGTNVYPYLKNNSPGFNVTYEEYIKFLQITHAVIGEYLGARFTINSTHEGVIVTIKRM